MLFNLIQYRGKVGILISRHFVFNFKDKIQPLLNHSQSNVFSYYASLIRNSILFFLFLAVFLILKLNNSKKNPKNSRASPFLVTVTKTWSAVWFYSLLFLLSGDVELNPGPKHNSRNAFLIVFGV